MLSFPHDRNDFHNQSSKLGGNTVGFRSLLGILICDLPIQPSPNKYHGWNAR